jgi:hypothetical protein
MRSIFALAALLVGITSFVSAKEPVPGKSIEQLIDQLGSPDFTVREAAAKAIEALGPEALPALRKAKDHPDLEVRRRIKEWIPKFETEAFVAPKRVTLDVKKEPLEKVVAELARQTGYQLELATKDARPQKPISLRFAKTTFWEALDKVCQEGGLELHPEFGSPEKLTLSFEGKTSPYRAYQGAFRIRANSFRYLQQTSISKNIDFARLPRNAGAGGQGKEQKDVSEIFSFQFDFMAEPRLTVLYQSEPSLTEAMDDQKRSLLPKKMFDFERFGPRTRFVSSSRMGQGFFSYHDLSTTVDLLAPAKDARSVKVLRGTIPVFLEKERKRTVLVENIAKAQGKKHKSDEFTVEIDLFKQLAGNNYNVYFTFTKNQRDGKDSDRGDGSFELEDAKGHRYQAHGSGWRSDGRTTVANISFGPPFNNAGQLGPPVRLVYIRSIPMEYHVPFEFKDLPLP